MRTRTLAVRTERDRVDAKLSIAEPGPVGVLLAHGAGLGQSHPWMVTMRKLVAADDLPVMTFDYAYMAQGRKAPDRLPRLLEVHAAAASRMLEFVDSVIFAGKSMGSRVGAHLADDGAFAPLGLLYYGYPLVPMGKREPRPTDHLERLDVPQLFFAGTRDRLSPPDLIQTMAKRLHAADVEVIAEADHSFRVPKRTGLTNDEVLAGMAATSRTWISRLGGGSDRRRPGPD